MTGASITDRGILVALAGMSRVLDVDVTKRLARVEPGVTIGQLNAEHRVGQSLEHCALDLYYAVLFGHSLTVNFYKQKLLVVRMDG